MEYKIGVMNGNGETETKLVSESEYRQWLRQQFKSQLSGRLLEDYIEKRIMDVKYKRRSDVIRY